MLYPREWLQFNHVSYLPSEAKMTKWYQTDEQLANEIEKNNPCPACGSGDVAAQRVVTRNWRGWSVECLDCGEVAEYDDPEEPADPRSL